MDQQFSIERVNDPTRLEGHYGEIAEVIGQLLGREKETPGSMLFLASPAAKRNIRNTCEHSHLLILWHHPQQQSDLVIGMATLIDVYKPTRYEGRIEDVVVHERHRRQKLGNALLLRVIDYAKQLGMSFLSLHSNPDNPNHQNVIQLCKKLRFEERCGLMRLTL
jgi:GNAT superfamily N-acetyltransferase